VTDRRRQRARKLFGGRCAYCGVHEDAAGATLTVDHYQARSRGGSDDEDNLVYACPRCNEHKGAYWHLEDLPHIRLLHPGRDDLAFHLREEPSGRLIGLTSEGRFFIERLRLNRAPLVAHRVRLRAGAAREVELASARQRVAELERHITDLRAAVESTTDEIQRLSVPKRKK
jgi:HNH endonuclease